MRKKISVLTLETSPFKVGRIHRLFENQTGRFLGAFTVNHDVTSSKQTPHAHPGLHACCIAYDAIVAVLHGIGFYFVEYIDCLPGIYTSIFCTLCDRI